MSGRVTPFFCPYCGEEDLRPNESAHGVWECRGCIRVFGVRFIGMLAIQAHRDPGSPHSPSDGESALGGQRADLVEEETR
ncbi:MAG TPA: hypothetical protein VHJ83_10855 [Micromonosporaceae bacterium]|nr:hypothetical protein [Micromonosporaceae bacterium]